VAPHTNLRCWSSHALRKGGFTCAVESGIPLPIVNRIVGHVSTDMPALRAGLYSRRPCLLCALGGYRRSPELEGARYVAKGMLS
jgi:hypothetical protein